ncbi:MAG: class I SAM-dependent methyltransferase [Candidatus Omnitrophica bacterium]|nr:class I SAM-dependent methyltransferase [Candidatus Omnitrophota bacterium]
MHKFTKKEIENNYQEHVNRIREFRILGLDRVLLGKDIVKHIDSSINSILEIGTGKGSLTALLAKISRHVTSVDIDKASQYKAGLLLAHEALIDNVCFKLEDAQKLLYDDNSFDLVISAFSFHHFQEPFKVIDQIIRLAKKQIIITEFNDRGFRLVEEMHEKENNTHKRIHENFDDVLVYLKNKGAKVFSYENLWSKTYVVSVAKGVK